MRHEDAVPQIIFTERGLALVAVLWPWAIVLILVRHVKQNPIDCAGVLRVGVAHRGIRWTLAGLKQWVMERLLADGLCRVPAPAEVAVPSADTGRPHSRASL
jgi:hypothetical protein